MDVSKLHLGIMFGLEDLDVAGKLEDEDVTYSELANHIVERVLNQMNEDES